MEKIDYKNLDMAGMIGAGLVPPKLEDGNRKLAAIWSLACCIKASKGRQERSHVVKGFEIHFKEGENPDLLETAGDGKGGHISAH